MNVFSIEIDNKNELAERGHFHLMTKDWGGEELTTEKQNQSEEIELLHQLKIMYWKS